jgi:pimeloyl-ACP methyl ester carboxylesterase
MIGGSGPTDRSNGGYFVAYLDQFTSDGIATLWYDKRGVGESSGNWAVGTLDDLADDAIAAISALRRVLGDSAPVGLFGHSEGGWVALRTADRLTVTRAISAEAWPEHDKIAALRLYDDLAEAAADDCEYAYVQHLLTSAPQYDILRPYIEPLDEAAHHKEAPSRRAPDTNDDTELTIAATVSDIQSGA